MPREGFSIDDLLNPKEREYYPESSPTHHAYRKTQTAKIIARKVQKELKMKDIPVILEPVIEYLGVHVIEVVEIQNNRAIGCYRGNGRIEIMKNLPRVLYRSTLAHELGHVALEHEVRDRWDTLDDIYSPDPHEREAWDFAGELLIPHAEFKKIFDQGKNIEEMANFFQVSKDFLVVELTRQKILK